jgi:hypothetical protein
MKKVLFTTFLCIYATLLAFGSSPESLKTTGDSTRTLVEQPLLTVSRARVYNGNILLKKIDVYNILSISPSIAAQYDRAVNLRSKGTALIVGGAVVTIGGIVVAATGMETNVDSNGYASLNYTHKYYTGLLVSAIGELMIGGGITCEVIGKVKIGRSVSNYNAYVRQTGFAPQSIKYQFGLLDNGNFGLKLTF